MTRGAERPRPTEARRVKAVKKGESRHGRHANPRLVVVAPRETVDRWKVAAEAAGLTLSEWARQTLDRRADTGMPRPKTKVSRGEP